MASADLSRINTNIAALNALNALNKVNSEMSMHQLRLATGKKINSASDDAAGFTIASKLKVKSEGLGTALDNIGSAKNLMTVAEGHLTNIQDILAKMKSKAEQAASDTLGDSERTAIFNELKEYNNQINSEVAQAKWAGVDILSTAKSFQIGVGTSSSDALTFNVAGNVSGLTGTSATFDSNGLAVLATSSNIEVIESAMVTGIAAADATASDVAMTSLTGLTAITATVAVVAAGTISMTQISTTTALAATTSLEESSSELETGNYTLKLTTSVSGGTTTIAMQMFDASGATLSIDSDGDASTAGVGATLSFTIAGTMAVDAGAINLGNGLTVDLGAIATSNGASGTIALAYTKSVAAAGTASVAVTTSLSTGLTELASGNYSLVISSSGATGTLQLLDEDGVAQTIDANGNISDTSTATSLSFTITGDSDIESTTFNLGNGLTIDLGAMSTGTAIAATIALAYTQSIAYAATVAAGAVTAGVARGNDVVDQAGAQAFMGKIDTAIDNVSAALSYVGTQFNRLTFQEQSMTVAKVNTESAYSQIVNADMAWEQLQSTKLQILQQTATAMLAQANVAPQSILSLFK